MDKKKFYKEYGKLMDKIMDIKYEIGNRYIDLEVAIEKLNDLINNLDAEDDDE